MRILYHNLSTTIHWHFYHLRFQKLNLKSSESDTMNDNDIATKCGKAAIHLRYCPIHKTQQAYQVSNHAKYDNIVYLFCATCERGNAEDGCKKSRHELGRWMICTSCANGRTPFLKEKQATKHQKNVHGLLPKQQQDGNYMTQLSKTPPICSITVDTSSYMHNDDDVEFEEEIDFDGYNDKNRLFFSHEILHLGIEYLIGKAHYTHGSDICDQLNKTEVLLQLTLASLIFASSKKSKSLLANVLQQMKSIYSLLPTGINNDKLQLKIPETTKEVRQLYLEGVDSLYENLPHPPIKKCGDIAYV